MIKILAVIVGLFLVGLAFQYHQIVNINWNKLQQLSEGDITTISNTIIIPISCISGGNSDGHAAATASLAMNSFDIPLSGSMSAGFTIGFIKG